MVFSDIITIIKDNYSVFRSIIVVILLIILFNFILRFTKRFLLKKAKTKNQISNIKVFAKMLQVFFILIVILFAFFSYIGSWTGLGLVVGLFTAALGFALQKPIAGVAAWIMVIIKRPFRVGDRIIIGEIRGEVYDISLTHIYIDEIGGAIDSDEFSGRNIMIPNHFLFEHNIINYTLTNDYILGEISVSITYESDLDKAIKISEEVATKFVKDYSKVAKREPSIRVKMGDSSMILKIRFFAPVKIMQKVSSDITKEIYDRIKREKMLKLLILTQKLFLKIKHYLRKNRML